MTKYVAPEYLFIEQNLGPFIAEHDLDSVTIKSLIRGSVEVLEPEPPNALLTVIDANNLQKGSSIKLRNIKFNVQFALQSIFSMKDVCDEKGMWSVLAFIKAIYAFVKAMHISFGQIDAIVLFCVYRLRSATVPQIIEYHNESNFDKKIADIVLSEKNVQSALADLEKLGIVGIDGGEYFVKESIIVRNNT